MMPTWRVLLVLSFTLFGLAGQSIGGFGLIDNSSPPCVGITAVIFAVRKHESGGAHQNE